MTFLKENLHIIGTFAQRKSFRPYQKISMLMKTRSPQQVKSHHQKLLLKFGKIETIILKME